MRFHGICPIVTGKSARNNSLFVTLPPDAMTLADGQSPKARKGHEVGEWYLRHVGGAIALLFALPWVPGLIAQAGGGTAETIVALAVVYALGTCWNAFASRTFDLTGHTIEILIAEREGFAGYREAEIGRMLTRDSTFRGEDPAGLAADIKRKEGVAKRVIRWVRL